MYKHNIETCLHNRCCHVEAIGIMYSECVSVAFVIHHVQCMCCIILLSVSCLSVSYFSPLSHKQHKYWTERYGI